MSNIEPHTGGGGWISGPSTSVPHRDLPDPPALGSEIELGLARDLRPRYNPELVLLSVVALLSDEGIDLKLTDAQRRVATVRAGDLLTTLGVAPERMDRPIGR